MDEEFSDETRLDRLRAQLSLPVVFAVVLAGVVAGFAIFSVDWGGTTTPGDFAIMAGTFSLAAATLFLARSAQAQVGWTALHAAHSERQADAAVQAVEAADKPWIVSAPHRDHPDGIKIVTGQGQQEPAVFYCRLWNLGKGSGIVYRMRLTEPDGRELLSVSGPNQADRIMGIGQGHDLACKIDQITIPVVPSYLLRIYYYGPSALIYKTTSYLNRDGDILAAVGFLAERVSVETEDWYWLFPDYDPDSGQTG